jgi:hypothetical protein
MKIRTKAPNFALAKKLMKIQTKAPNFGWMSGRTELWRENMMLTLRSTLKYVSNFLYVSKNSPRRLVQFWQNFQTSLVLLIPNCTRHRMITYTNRQLKLNISDMDFSILKVSRKKYTWLKRRTII